MNKYAKEIEALLSKLIRSEKERELVQNTFYIEEIKKGHFFLEKGEPCNKFGFIIKGSLYSYDYNNLGEKVISGFYYLPSNYIVSDYESYVFGKKVSQWYESFEDVAMLSFNRTKFNTLFEKMPQLYHIRLEIVENNYYNSLNTIKRLQGSNATNKVKELYQQSPEIFKTFPYHYIASFLGMHRNTFRRTLRNLSI